MNDTLEFPEIVDAAPAPRTDVAVAAAGAIDLAKIDLTDVALAQFGKWRPAAAKLKADNEKLVLDLSTQAKIDEAVSLRQRTINQPKAAANKVATALKSKFAQTSKSVGAEVEALHKAYDEAGEPLTAQITAAQKKLDDEKEAKRKAEEARLQGLRDTVDQIMVKWLDRCKVDGMTAERITAGIELFAKMPMPAEVADVKAYWATTYADTAASMVALRDAANGREVAAALEAQRVENARLAAESERLQAELAAARAAVSAAKLDAPQAGPAGDGSQKPDDAAAIPGAEAGSEYTEARDSQQVLKAEPATADATDRDAPATASPSVGSMGVGQAADAAAAGEAVDTRPPINVGEMNRRLGFTVTSTFVKDTLGITPEGFSKGGTAIWSARAWPLICAALVAHVQEKAGE